MTDAIAIVNKKGLKLACDIHTPLSAGRHPAVLILHGFTGYKDERHLVNLAELLCEHNYVVARFDTSGFGQSDGTIEQDYRMSNYLDDIECILAHLKSMAVVDVNFIGLCGHSMGALMTVIHGARDKQIAALCGISAPTQMARARAFKNEIEGWKAHGLTKQSSKYGLLTIPYAFYEDSIQYDGLQAVESIHRPIMLIAGSSDQQVEVADTRALYNAACDPKRFVELSEIGHDYKNDITQIREVNRYVLSFFDSWLKYDKDS